MLLTGAPESAHKLSPLRRLKPRFLLAVPNPRPVLVGWRRELSIKAYLVSSPGYGRAPPPSWGDIVAVARTLSRTGRLLASTTLSVNSTGLPESCTPLINTRERHSNNRRMGVAADNRNVFGRAQAAVQHGLELPIATGS